MGAAILCITGGVLIAIGPLLAAESYASFVENGEELDTLSRIYGYLSWILPVLGAMLWRLA